MKNHIWRPLYVTLAGVVIMLIARAVVVPSDFGINGESYTYNFYRLSNVDEWKNFAVKYKGKEHCRECHEEKVEENLSSPHSVLECENCHGPALEHPANPETLPIESSRLLCLRCHAYLPYPQSNRADMPAVDTDSHNPGENCIECHNPHHPNLENM